MAALGWGHWPRVQEGALVTLGGSHKHCCMPAFQQMDNAVYTFETLLHQELGKGPTKEELCKSIQRILERVLKVRLAASIGLESAWPAEPRADCPAAIPRQHLVLRCL